MTSVMSMRKMLRDKGTSAPPGSVHPFVLLPVWGNATHESGWTHGTLGNVRSGHSDGLPLAVEALIRGVYTSFKTRKSSLATRPVHPYRCKMCT